MSNLTKQTSKLSTLDAASKIYFLIAGLAIKESLGLFSGEWQTKHSSALPSWWGQWGWYVLMVGYLATVLRFSHGISLLHGHEKDRIENSTFASAAKITLLSLFLVFMGIFFFLMGDSIANFKSYLMWTALMLALDVIYIVISGIARDYPFRPVRAWKETAPGYAPRAALEWIYSDVILIVLCGLFYYLASNKVTYPGYALGERALETLALLFGIFASWVRRIAHYSFTWNESVSAVALSACLFLATLLDYLFNKAFYFGGGKDWRVRKRFVFVCSPLSANNNPDELAANIRRAHLYSQNLMRTKHLRFYKIIPFTPHAFFTYFLEDSSTTDRLIRRQCALSFLAACDAVYVYLPRIPRWDLSHNFFKSTWLGRYIWTLHLNILDITKEAARPVKWYRRFFWKLDMREEKSLPGRKKRALSAATTGMKREIEEAQRLGLYFKYVERVSIHAEWKQTCYSPVVYTDDDILGLDEDKSDYHDKGLRKRVYVCTEFRGNGFDDLSWAGKVQRLQDNIRLAFWLCHELARDEEAFVAPFAPQAFFPFFCDFMLDGEIKEEKWDEWFERSIDILKVCDAVYIYSKHGMLHDERDLSKGMREVKGMAELLGIEISYPVLRDPPPRTVWDTAVPDFQ